MKIIFVSIFLYYAVEASVPEFRVLAPQFVCPKTNKSTENAKQLDITIKSSQDNIKLTWTVGWVRLQAPSQRFTIILWKTIRALEKKLNSPQPEHFVYIIKDSELLSGVVYAFNVTGTTKDGECATKNFYIDYSVVDHKLNMKRNDMLSVQLLGGQKTFSYLEFAIEAHVKTCVPTQDYYFTWTISDYQGDVSMSETGSRLIIPPLTLTPGIDYILHCKVNKQSNGKIITQLSLPIQVLYQDLKLYLSVDRLVVSVGKTFTIGSYIANQNDHAQHLAFEWQCLHKDMECTFIGSTNTSSWYFPIGVPDVSEYKITLTLRALNQSATANATIIGTETNLPVLEIEPIDYLINEGTDIFLTGNASNLLPSCTLAWYFIEEHVIFDNETFDGYQNAVGVSDVINVYSMEEVFLNELIDYSKETQWREVSAHFKASSGRARLVANCSCCYLAFNCDVDGVSYAEVNIYVNNGPLISELMITPDSGVALETLFRISTLAALDGDGPLYYYFYCIVGDNNTLLLDFYMEHLAVETYLPFIDGGTKVFIEVCDSLGACSKSGTTTVYLQQSDEHTVPAILDDMEAHVRRCELLHLQRLVVSAVVNFTNGNQSVQVSMISNGLLKLLPDMRLRCSSISQYGDILDRLTHTGLDTEYIP